MSTATPELTDILATLARFAPPPNNGFNGHTILETAATSVDSAFTPHEADATQQRPEDESPRDPRMLRPQSRTATASPKPVIDPATITTWQNGLRCVTKIAAQNAQFATSIKKMMADQRTHELRWYRERQALKQAQVNRSSSATNALSILQSLNPSGNASDLKEQTDEEKQAELTDFDCKIHAAQQSMETSFSAGLKLLGVPFFGTEPSLVVSDGYDLSNLQLAEGYPKWSAPITETQLLNLRRKMIGHLEDLYCD